MASLRFGGALRTEKLREYDPNNTVVRAIFSGIRDAWQEHREYRRVAALFDKALKTNDCDGIHAFSAGMKSFKQLPVDAQLKIVTKMAKLLSSASIDPYHDIRDTLAILTCAEFFSGLPKEQLTGDFSETIRDYVVVESLVTVIRIDGHRTSDKAKVDYACASALSNLGYYYDIRFWSERLRDSATRNLAIHELLRLNNGHANEQGALEFIRELMLTGNSDNVSQSDWPGIIAVTSYFASKNGNEGQPGKEALVKFAEQERPGAKETLETAVSIATEQLDLAGEGQFLGAATLIGYYLAGAKGLEDTLRAIGEDMKDIIENPAGETDAAKQIQVHNATAILVTLVRLGFAPEGVRIEEASAITFEYVTSES